MNQLKRLEIALWLAVILWLLLALFLTFQSGGSTAATSTGIAKTIWNILHACGTKLDYSALHRFLRISAHFFVFCVYGILLEAAIQSGSRENNRLRLIGFRIIACMLVCVVPEIIKLWIPGRHLQWNEAGLNVIGAFIGEISVYAIPKIRERSALGRMQSPSKH